MSESMRKLKGSDVEVPWGADVVLVEGDCKEHGKCSYEVPSGPWQKRAGCPECSRIRREQEEEERAQRELAQRVRENARKSGVPKRFQKKTLGNYQVDDQNKKAFSTCDRYAKKFEKVLEDGISLCFCGKPGTGKTHLAIAVLDEALRKGIEVRYATVIEMIREVKDTYRSGSEYSEGQVIQKFSRIPFLVLDEVGMQFGSDTEKLILSEIIDRRYSGVRPTVLISNLGLKELREYIGDRVMDRMREGGGAVISFDWESKRGEL